MNFCVIKTRNPSDVTVREIKTSKMNRGLTPVRMTGVSPLDHFMKLFTFSKLLIRPLRNFVSQLFLLNTPYLHPVNAAV